jgi:hypothetical protein
LIFGAIVKRFFEGCKRKGSLVLESWENNDLKVRGDTNNCYYLEIWESNDLKVREDTNNCYYLESWENNDLKVREDTNNCYYDNI